MVIIKKWARYFTAVLYQFFLLWWLRNNLRVRQTEVTIVDRLIMTILNLWDFSKVCCKMIFIPKHFFTHKLEMFDALIGWIFKLNKIFQFSESAKTENHYNILEKWSDEKWLLLGQWTSFFSLIRLWIKLFVSSSGSTRQYNSKWLLETISAMYLMSPQTLSIRFL